MADEIWRWDAVRIAKAVGKREISAREAVASCVERMEGLPAALTKSGREAG